MNRPSRELLIPASVLPSMTRERQSGRLFLALCLGALLFAGVLALPPRASAGFGDYYCGRLLQPGQGCLSRFPHTFDHSVAWYNGAEAHRVRACTYLYNHGTNRIRGGVVACRQVWGGSFSPYRAQVNFGVTYDAAYQAVAYLDPGQCCAHTIGAYAETSF